MPTSYGDWRLVQLLADRAAHSAIQALQLRMGVGEGYWIAVARLEQRMVEVHLPTTVAGTVLES